MGTNRGVTVSEIRDWRQIGLVVVAGLIMVLGSSVAIATLASVPSSVPASAALTGDVTGPPIPAPGAPPPSSAPAPAAAPAPSAKTLGINEVLAASVKAKEQAILAAGGNLSNFHPPNLHQAPPLKETGGVVTPLYDVAPAPMGVAYYGLNNTTGTIQATTLNTSSLAGTWSTTDAIGTAAELFDTSAGNAAGEFGAQLNTVLVNVTLKGQTSFTTDPNAPSGCPTTSIYIGLPDNACPNEFWLQNYIEYVESTHTLTISNEIWNFSNPTADFTGGSSTLVGFGSVEESEVYQGPSSGTITVAPPFSLVLYLNYSQGPCHTDTVPGTGVGSCGAVSTTEPVNELFMNYTVRNSLGVRVCPSTVPTGRVCGEDDDIFFNSVGPSNPSGVPEYGPCPTYPVGCTTANARIGSATIQANGTGYDPLGLTNDFEFDYGIGSDDGATNNIVYQDGIVGLGYCPNADAVQSAGGGITCSAYSTTPAAVDYGGETGETSTGEMAYWTPQGSSGSSLIAPYVSGAATPVVHLDTGPSLLVGLWNMTGNSTCPNTPYSPTYHGCPYSGHPPYPAYTGGEPLSYQYIAPANAWLGVAQDQTPGVTVTSQFYFQVAPTFGFFSYWKGSGGAPTTTTLGPNLYLPTGWYTIEVLLSGYEPFVEQIDLTDAQAPVIHLIPDAATGAYTPDWAFSNSDLANLTVSPSNTLPTGAGTLVNPYIISAPAPDVSTVTSISGGQVVLGEPGSVSWLFSNLNDYTFTVWIGAFINSTTAVTQFNPAPSFPIDYPSWQVASLENSAWWLPLTDGFQYYLLNTQNLAVIGASNLYAWANAEATSIYEVIVNNGANDLIAGNHFSLTNRGVDFTGGGTTDTSTINGAGVTFQYDSKTRNVVWGNTFLPAPLSAPYGGNEPFTAQDSLTLGEGFDRVYDNAFDAYSSTINATANAGSTDTAFWNATCVSGYSPLSQETYPGTPNPGTGVCEPLSYSKSLDDYTMSGSVVPVSYQGGNFWAAYGNEPNPYGNIPVKLRLTSLTGPAEIGSSVYPYFGDMAPLIGYSVSELTFTETGLPSSATSTEFTMRITSTTSHYTWLNTSATSATPAGCAPSTVCVNFYVPLGTYTYTATPPTGYAANPTTGSVAFSTPSTVVAMTFAVGYAVTFTETGLPAATRWYINTTGQLSLTGTGTTLAQTLSSGTYTFLASTVNTLYAWSSSPTFTVSGASLGVGVTFSIPTISVSPSQGPIGATVTISGTGFNTSTPLASLVFDALPISSCAVGSLTTGGTGAFSCTIAVPSGTSGTSVVAVNSGGQTATGTFTVTVPAITVSPSQGPVGATYTVAGSGFSVSSGATVSFGGVDQTPTGGLDCSYVGTAITTDGTGAFSCTFAVPSEVAGPYSVVGEDTATSTLTTAPTFTVTTPSITVSPSQGPVGATVTVAGTGFSVSSTVGLVLDGVTIPSCTSGSLGTDSSGDFSCTFAVPSGTSGTTVTATDVGGQTATGTFTVTVPKITVSPKQGPIGEQVSVSGSGFSESSTVSLVFDSVVVSSCTSGSLSTGLTGAFSCTFLVPSGTSGTVVAATDIGGQQATGKFTVTTPTITVSPKRGPVGAVVTVSGKGFSVSSTAGLIFDGVSIGTCSIGGGLTTSGTGTFSCSFAVPSGTSGTTVTATDTGGQHATGKFTVTTPTIKVTPTKGPAGSTVTVSGTGFSVSTTLKSLLFDNVLISSCTSGSLTTNAAGSFSCTFVVPSGTSGTTVTATDAGGQYATAKFTVT